MEKSIVENLVRVVSEEVARGLNGQHRTGSTSSYDCPWCGLGCGDRCKQEVKRMLTVGAGRVSALGSGRDIDRSIAKLIDHTLLKSDATYADVERICNEASQYGFASVCVYPALVPVAHKFLNSEQVKICAVVGLPLGATFSEVKALEAEVAISNGAREIDMVMNIAAFKSKDFSAAGHDMRRMAEICHAREAICKVIIEAGCLTDDEKVSACSLVKASGADFVKTSAGLGPGGSSAKDVALMSSVVGHDIGAGASGSMRDWETLQAMLKSGATQIGASASVKIIHEAGSVVAPSQLSTAEWPGNDYY